MAVTVKTLYKNGTFLYKMKLLAGKSGLTNTVQWVHIIEDDSVSPFLHGGELVFTAGILNRQDGWLLGFARKLTEAGASALVVNVGPHTKEVSPAVLDFCNEAGLPLFTIPWETKMVDMTRDFCQRIIQDENRVNTITSMLKNIIYKTGDMEAQILQMERYGFQRDGRFCFLAMGAKEPIAGDAEERDAALKSAVEAAAKNRSGLYVTFTQQDYRVIALANYSETDVEGYLEDLTQFARRRLPGASLHLGVSPNSPGIYSLNASLEKAISALEMAKRRMETVAFYDRLGIYKVLYSVGDKGMLRSYYAETVGKLEQYDRENGANLTPLLRDYLQNNGSLQAVAEKHFVHRNTVTNQLKKIESITGFNPLVLEDKVKFCVGFYISEML